MGQHSIEFRPHNWLNTETLQPIYSIQGRRAGDKWRHVSRDAEPLFYDCEADRDAKIVALTRAALSRAEGRSDG